MIIRCPMCDSSDFDEWNRNDNYVHGVCRDCGVESDIPYRHNEKGLYEKYSITNNETGEHVFQAFVLRPQRDKAARHALEIYANAISDTNPTLARELLDWVNRLDVLATKRLETIRAAMKLPADESEASHEWHNDNS